MFAPHRTAHLNSAAHNLKVRESPTAGVFVVENLTKHPVETYGQVMDLLTVASLARTTSTTNMNATSSRSHAVFVLELRAEVEDPEAPGGRSTRDSKMTLVDLAGSERANGTDATGDRIKEAANKETANKETANINKSLSTLGNVIAAITAQHPLVPHHESALTGLLKGTLGGNSKTVVLATVSPSEADYDETLATLRYVERAGRIVNNAVVNDGETNPIVLRLRRETSTLRDSLWEKETATAVALKENLSHLSIVEALGRKQIRLMYKYDALDRDVGEEREAAADLVRTLEEEREKRRVDGEEVKEVREAMVRSEAALNEKIDDLRKEKTAAAEKHKRVLEAATAAAKKAEETEEALARMASQMTEAATLAQKREEGLNESVRKLKEQLEAFTTPPRSSEPPHTGSSGWANPNSPFTPPTPVGKDSHRSDHR